MPFSTIARLAMLAMLGMTGASLARTPMSKAEAVVEASKRATGGSRWDSVAGCEEEGSRGGGMTYTTRFSLEKYGMRVDSRRGDTSRSMGFDGKVRWQSLEGKTDIRADADSLREARLTNYLSINGFFFPERFPATFKYLRQAKEAGGKFDVLEITASGARPLEVWFDRRTHFIRKVVDTAGTPPVTVVASDYRRFGDFTVAGTLTISAMDGTVVGSGVVASFRCGAVDSAIFDPPGAR